MRRRSFLKRAGFSIPAAAAVARLSAFGTGKRQTVHIVQFDAAGIRTGIVEVEKVEKSESEWRKQLTAQQFEITRQAGTEIPGTGKYANNHADGLYHCICCDTVLFDSKTKFESGTGWPSFWQPIAKQNVREQEDDSHGMRRSEVLCARCDAHLGHVFDDGPLRRICATA
jgi:peptide-methionine (R)-S-oxide reductase